MSVAAIVLAAGQATRFGRDKRQAILPDGRSMLDSVLDSYAQVFDPVLLVVRADDAFAQGLAERHGARIVISEQAGQGMGHSLAAGAQALLSLAGLPIPIDAVVIGLADMPAIAQSTLLALRAALEQQAQPVLPVHEGQMGHPRGLPRAYLEAMGTLTGDMGARHLLDWSAAMQLPVNDPGVLLDIDHPDDLNCLRV
jgi:molybdenum cofactor cytidylyltransferase